MHQILIVEDDPALSQGIRLADGAGLDELAPFLAQSFSEVHLLDLLYYRAPVAQYAAENGIDEIVVLYSVPNFITDRNLVLLTQ